MSYMIIYSIGHEYRDDNGFTASRWDDAFEMSFENYKELVDFVKDLMERAEVASYDRYSDFLVDVTFIGKVQEEYSLGELLEEEV